MNHDIWHPRVPLIATLFAVLFVPEPAWSAATAVYLAQSAQGANNGTNCANARPASYFNSGSNWGTGATQIGAGTKVYLCGTITANLTFQGSGSMNDYVTLDGAGATFSGYVREDNRSWWKIQNITWVDGSSSGVMIYGGSNGIVDGIHLDDYRGDPAIWLAQGTARPNNITIRNSYIRTTAADLGNTQHDIIKTEGSTNVVLEGNHLEMRVGGAGTAAHNDCIQTYEKGGTSYGPPENWTIRYNRIVMNSAASADRSWTMIQALRGTNYIYNNVFLGIQGAGGGNGLSLGSPGTYHIYNNTFVAKSGASNNTINVADGTYFIKNNIIYTENQTAFLDNSSQNTITRSNNVWYGSRLPSCSGITGELCNQNPLFTNYGTNDFSLRSGSPAIDAGSNLGSPYDRYIVQGSAWPTPTLSQRPASGAWDVGAHEYSSDTTALPTPTNLRVVQ